MLWAAKTEVEAVQMSLIRAQRLICICITGAMNSSPTVALEIFFSLPRMNVFIKPEANLAVGRLFRNEHWVAKDSKVSHAKLLTDLIRRLPKVEINGDYMPGIFRFERNFELFFPQKEERANGIFPKKGDISMCTDGSKTDERTEAGLHCEDLNYCKSLLLGDLTIVYQSEILALKKVF